MADRTAVVRTNLPAWLGLAEVLCGFGLTAKGCHYSVTHDDTLSTMMYMPAAFVSVFGLILPGLWLFRSHQPLRWAGQILPALLLAWLVVVLVSFRG
jgi:hypothetical protein